MVKQHLKRLSAPSTWPIVKKGLTFVKRPRPGSHTFEHGTSIDTFMKDMVGLASSSREVLYILNQKQVVVNGTRRKDPRFLVGLFDVVSFPDIKKSYRIIITRKRVMEAIEIDEKEAALKPSRVIGKTPLAKDKVQLNLGDGRNVLMKSKESYKIGDTVIYDLKAKKVAEHIPLDKKTIVCLISGKHAGATGHVEDVKGNKIIVQTKDKETFETRKKYAFPVGKDKVAITIQK